MDGIHLRRLHTHPLPLRDGVEMGIFSGIGTALIGGALGLIGGSKQNKAAQAASQAQMDFQERMSNTQYQRVMEDMQKAGLNPMLAYKQGGAGTPGGSTYSPVNVGTAAAQGAQAGASSASQVKRTAAEIANLQADTQLKYETRNKTVMDTRASAATIDNLREQYEVYKADAASARATADFYNSPIGAWMRKLDLMGRSINPFANSAKSLRR